MYVYVAHPHSIEPYASVLCLAVPHAYAYRHTHTDEFAHGIIYYMQAAMRRDLISAHGVQYKLQL